MIKIKIKISKTSFRTQNWLIIGFPRKKTKGNKKNRYPFRTNDVMKNATNIKKDKALNNIIVRYGLNPK